MMHYKTKGTCSSAIDLEIEDGKITACHFTGGCRGNTNGLAKVVVGQDAKEVMERLRGIPCRGDTSCPDQLSRAIEQYLNEHKAQ
ncbi:MAG: TIGR03905 family TSCPD domain-containing protein [Candidatus Limiplasma sp.]|nr:TIGR03905 family TSCPD domain-containing protein [Candidatus Limiplasma sp.]